MKMLTSFYLIAVVIAGNLFAAAEEGKTLSKSNIRKTWTRINLWNKGYTAVDNETFRDCTKTIYLNLASNLITALPEFVFSPLKNLVNLDLHGNLISDTKNAFAGLDKLKDLNISNNSLRVLGPNFFTGLTSQCTIKLKNDVLLLKIHGDVFGSKPSTSPRNIGAIDSSNAKANNTISSPEQTNFEFQACTRNSILVQLSIQSKNNNSSIHCYPVRSFGQMLHLDMGSISKVEKGWYRVADKVAKSANVTGLKIFGLSSHDSISNILNELPVYFKRLLIEDGAMPRLTKGTLKHNGVVELFLTSNNISSIELGTFDMPKLKKLKLNKNRLRDIDLSKTLPSTIEELDFSSNGIIKIAANSFTHLKDLRKLFLEQNEITAIEVGAFKNLDKLEQLSLRWNRITDIKPATFYMPKLMNLNLNKNSLNNTNFLKTLPPSLEELDLGLNGITKISADSVSHLKSLKKLSLDTVKNDTIELSGFKRLRSLKELSLRWNKISNIKPGTFEMLDVKILNLHGNRLNDTSSLITLSPTIETLDLGWNHITTVTSKSFSRLRNLKELSLDHNKITTIELGAFEYVPNSKVLPRRQNERSSTKPNISQKLNLKILNLRNNPLSNISSLVELPQSIETLDLGSNQFETITANAFSHLKNLKKLSLNENKLITIELGAFKHLQDLEFLDLSFNVITVLEARVFTGLKNLEGLNLRGNSLTRLNASIHDLSKLKSLDLAHNNITIIEKGAMRNLRQLCLLSLHENPIHKLGNGELFGLQKTSSCYVTVTGTELETLEGGVFDDV